MADDSEQDRVPEQLAADLNSLYEPPIQVPARVNDAILNRARAQFARRRSWRWRSLRWVGAAAAAAACLFLVVRLSIYPSSNTGNANHRTTIVDALVLAKQIESGKGRDVNGDGVIDQKDVDSIAMIAVRLDEQPGGIQ